MIKIIERYITKTILTSTAFAALIIVAVSFLMTLLGELKNVGEGDYSVAQAIWYVFLRLPTQVYQFSPMLMLLGSIIGLSALSTYKELAVMRAAGFSIKRIILSVFTAVLLLVFLIGLMGEFIAPHLSYKAEVRKEILQNAGQAVVTASGVWFHVDNDFIHVQNVVGRQLLENVTRYQFDDQHHLQAAYFAKRLIMENGEWHMKDVLKTTFYQERTKSQAIPALTWTLKFNPNLLNVGLVDPSEMSLGRLVKFSRYLEKNGLQSTQYRYEFWQRVFQPIVSLLMVFLAIPFVLGAFSATTLGWRMVVGVICGFGFFIANAFLGQICIVYQVPPILAAFLPLLVFLVIGLILSNRLIRQ